MQVKKTAQDRERPHRAVPRAPRGWEGCTIPDWDRERDVSERMERQKSPRSHCLGKGPDWPRLALWSCPTRPKGKTRKAHLPSDLTASTAKLKHL